MKHVKVVTVQRSVVAPHSANAWQVFLNAVYQDTVDFIYAKLKLY